MTSQRQTLRDQRASLDPAIVTRHSAAVAHHLWRDPLMARSRDIAAYWAIGGEIDCADIAAEAWARGRRMWLPIIHRRELLFGRWEPGTALVANRYGIPEPATAPRSWRRGRGLDVVLAPLVGFDRCGTRLGMGGGYYDRALRMLIRHGAMRRPHFVGLAHGFQQVARLPRRAWDVPLEAVVTEVGVRRFSPARD